MKNLRLKSARAAKDLSQQQLAELNLCIAICKALDKTLDELFWEE